MTPTLPSHGPFLTRRNVVGGVVLLAGMALLLVPWFTAQATTFTMILGCVLAVFGALLVVPEGIPALSAVAHAAEPFVPAVQAMIERGGRRDTDPPVLTVDPAAEATPMSDDNARSPVARSRRSASAPPAPPAAPPRRKRRAAASRDDSRPDFPVVPAALAPPTPADALPIDGEGD